MLNNNKNTQILIIDDQTTAIYALKKILDDEYSVAYETEASKTLERLSNGLNPDLIILDINMPDIDGFEVYKCLKAREDTANIPVIFISGYDATSNELESLNLGAYDYIRKPFHPGITKARIKQVIEKQSRYHKIRQERDKIEKELHMKKVGLFKAQKIQRELNTETLPFFENYAVKSLFLPSQEIGGDFISINHKNELITFVLGDCEGHGIEAAIDSVLAKTICDYHIDLLLELKPEKFLEKVNIKIIEYLKEERFLTIFTGVLNTITGEFIYANGNAEIPCLIRDKKTIFLENPFGMFIGYDISNLNLKFEQKKVVLKENDILFFYSDALRELKIGNSYLGLKGVEEITSKFGNGLNKDIELVCDEIKKIKKLPLDDDLSIIACEFSLPYRSQETLKEIADYNSYSSELTEVLLRKNFSKDDISKILIAFLEMFVNAVKHGNKEHEDLFVEVSTKINYEKIEITIKDSGKGFDPKKVPDPTDIEELLTMIENGEVEKYTHGRGIWIAKKLMDEVTYNECGNSVKITKYSSNISISFMI
ncbi:MAG: SpoIIE family protein phosphatase [Spirochaetales bacterium]|nr:SpoIIE family protein phosphatase [Spirochaetales bacterium]